MGPVWDFDLAFGNFSYDNKKYDTADQKDDIAFGKVPLVYTLFWILWVDKYIVCPVDLKKLVDLSFGIKQETLRQYRFPVVIV